MKKALYFLIILILIQSFSFAKKERKKRTKKSKSSVVKLKDNYTFEDIEKLQDSYNTGDEKSLKTLIAIYADKNQSSPIRIGALEIISSSKDPELKIVLEKSISESEFVQSDIMKQSVYALIKMQDKASTDAFISGLSSSESKIMDLRASIIDAIGENNSEDKILTLLELYEISLSNHQRMNELLTLTLGEIEDDRSIPILMDIARNNNIDAQVRSRAVEILSRKDAPELVDFFVELIGSPSTNDTMQEFIHNSMGLENKDRMVMALLESYQAGKTRYHAVLYSIMGSLEDYQNPEVKPLFIEVAKTDGYPRLLRIKAIQSLAHFNDEKVLDELIPILSESNNYEYYYEINNLANNLNANESYINEIRKYGLNAMKTN